MPAEQVAYKLSSKAIRLIKSGQAEWTPGGIRDVHSKKIIELVKPVMTKTLTQKELMVQMSQSIKCVQALSWVNTALSLVNVGVSVAGFYMTLTKMESMHGDLRMFIDTYKTDRQSDTLETYNNHLQKITNHLAYLQSRYTSPVFDQHDFMNRRNDIENECIETANFLNKTITAFETNQTEAKLACQIIFTLAPVYAQLVNEYCCQYYCLCGHQHNQFEPWLSVLEEINSESFRLFMKKQMAFNVEYAELHPQNRKDVLTVAFDSIEELKNSLLLCAETIRLVPEHTLVPVENLLQEKIWEDIRDKMNSQHQDAPEEFVNHTIMQMAIDENDEEVYIPVQMMYS